MSLIEYTLFGKVDKVKSAIERIRLAEMSQEPLCVCYSGGKDSKVIRRLCEMAGVNYELHYNLTSVDHPSVVREILDDKEVIVDIPRDENGKQITMWSLIVQKKMPPTRLVRYCCEELKEENGKGRICVTGVRKAESASRKLNSGEVKILGKTALKIAEETKADYLITPKGGIVLNLDNAETRRTVERCYRTHKTLINPIIDWSDSDVWEFSRSEKIKQSDLYEQNGGAYKRLGCILCPMATCKEREKGEKDYPNIKEAYIRAFEKMLKVNSNVSYSWKSGEEVFEWWMNRSGNLKKEKGQISFLGAQNE